MSPHWTYASTLEGGNLEQGDFVFPTESLRAILKEVHPHFCDDKYLGFAITTQSCDLVLRKSGEPGARYISIASVRPLKQVLASLLSQVAPPVVDGVGVFRNSSKGQVRLFLQRLFNQNEQKLGLFYLHPDEALGIAEPAVAFLRVTVALRSQHYEVVRQSCRARLAPEFQAKFGWLIGNLYSRAASPDWAEKPGGEQALRKLVTSHLTEQIEGLGPLWVDDEAVDSARKAGVALTGLTSGQAKHAIEAHTPPGRMSRIADVVLLEAAKVLEMNDEGRERLRHRLLNNGHLLRLAKQNPQIDG